MIITNSTATLLLYELQALKRKRAKLKRQLEATDTLIKKTMLAIEKANG